eukprot:1496530-Pleurochrysis_carterae.AAC.2
MIAAYALVGELSNYDGQGASVTPLRGRRGPERSLSETATSLLGSPCGELRARALSCGAESSPTGLFSSGASFSSAPLTTVENCGMYARGQGPSG